MQQPVSSERQGGLSRLFDYVRRGIDTKHLKYLLTGLKIAAGLALLVWSIQGIQLNNLISGIRSANITWLALAILSIIAGLGLKLWRWAILVKNYRIKASITRLVSAYFVGQAANIALPLRGGELVRLGYLSGEIKMLPEAATTIVLEKYLDLLALTICGILVSFQISLDNILNLRGVMLPLALTASIVLVGAILLGPAVWMKIKNRKLLSQKTIDWIDRWVQASQWLRIPKRVFPTIILTLCIWGTMWLTNLLTFKSLGIALGGTAAGMVLILVYIGLVPALMPGNIGPFYFFARLALLLFGVSLNQAFTYAVILHAMVTLPPLLGGALALTIRSDRAVLA